MRQPGDHPDAELATKAAGIQRDLQRRLAANLRRLRDARRWGQEEAAWRANVTVRAYQRLEGGVSANPTMTTLSRICAAFEVDVRELFDPTNEPVVVRRPGRPKRGHAVPDATDGEGNEGSTPVG